MSGPALLEARNITKTFGRVRACDDVSLQLHPGEIVALLGENGAGKSTLVKLIFGALQPDEGHVLWHGRRVALARPADARQLGIGMVHQHFSLFEAFTAVENIALALEHQPRRELAERTRRVSRDYGLALDPEALVADLSAGERQRIEIVRCLLQDPTLIIMDEPTSVLTPQEADTLFHTLRRLKAEGRTILYISHKLEEVKALCERAIVMRAGRIVGELDPAVASAAEMAEAMVGKTISDVSPRPAPAAAAPLLAVNDLSHESDRLFGTSLKNVGFSVAPGEVFGIAGMAGNGQSELFGCLSGELLSDPGAIHIKGRPVGRLGVDARRRMGAAFVPEERLGHSAVPDFDLGENMILSRHGPGDGTVTAAGLLRRGVARATVRRVIGAMDVRAPEGLPLARMLSGGNLQKFVMGRELDRAPELLVVNQPTWGVDAGAAALIRQAVVDLAAGGAAVVLISQDLDELFQTAHKIAVIAGGRLSAPEPAGSLTRTDIGLLMGAGTSHEETPLAH